MSTTQMSNDVIARTYVFGDRVAAMVHVALIGIALSAALTALSGCRNAAEGPSPPVSDSSPSQKIGRLAGSTDSPSAAVLPVAVPSANVAAKPDATSPPTSDSSTSGANDSDRRGRFDAARLVAHPSGIEQRLRMTVRYLASDELEGRGIGTEGIERAAEFIAAEFRRAELKTDHFAGEPFQHFSQRVRLRITENNRLAARGPGGELEFASREDFMPLSLAASADVEAPMLFAGYGITATEAGYDDFAGIDATGRAVIVLRNEPRRFDPSSPLSGAEDSPHAQITRKIANAVEHGASAVVFVSDAASIREQAMSGGSGRGTGDVGGGLASYDSLMAFNVPGRSPARRVPVVHLHRRAAERLVREATGEELIDWEGAIDARFTPASRELAGWSLSGRIEIGRQTTSLKNVIATLEGSGPNAQETIVVGAHYDHLGYGGGWGSLAPWTRDVHNGADDNASGTTVMLEVARQLAARRQPLGRRIAFMAFTAEESGLIGSEYYVTHPLLPLDTTVAMLNLDMVGYLRRSRLEISGTGTAAEFNALVDEIGSRHAMRITKDPDGYGPSDHASFHGRGVPVLHFFTGFHDHYHRPSDDAERLDIAGMRRITQMATEMVVELAQRSEPPRRTESSFDSLLAELGDDASLAANNRRSTGGATAVPMALQPARVDPNIGWGLDAESVPSAPDRAGGLRLTRVDAGGWGARAGLRAGDVVQQMNGRPVTRLDEITSAPANPGETGERGREVRLQVLRGTVTLETTVALP